MYRERFFQGLIKTGYKIVKLQNLTFLWGVVVKKGMVGRGVLRLSYKRLRRGYQNWTNASKVEGGVHILGILW